MKARAILILGLMFFIWLGTVSALPNLARNHSFERGETVVADDWSVAWRGYSRVTDPGSWDGCSVLRLKNKSGTTDYAGARQRINFCQSTFSPVRFTVRVKGESIGNSSADKFGACLYAEIHMVDGSVAYTKNSLRTKNIGTFPWRWIGFNTANIPGAMGPIDYVDLFLMLGKVSGTAYFDSVTVEVFPKPSHGRVTLMFDDGWSETYTVAYPILRSRGMVGVTAVVTNYVGMSNYMGLPELHDLQDDGCWEVVSHSQDHVDLTTLTPDKMESRFWESKKYFCENNLWVESIALPFGSYNAEIMGRGEWYWRSIRGVEKGDNPPGTFPKEVMVQDVNINTPPEKWQEWLRKAEADHHWLILMFHRVKDGSGSDLTPATLCQITDTIFCSSLEVVTYKQGLDAYSDIPPNAVSDWTLY